MSLSHSPTRAWRLAFNTLWIAAASVLAVYNISKAVDRDGAIIEPDAEYTDGVIRRVSFLTVYCVCRLLTSYIHVPFSLSPFNVLSFHALQ